MVLFPSSSLLLPFLSLTALSLPLTHSKSISLPIHRKSQEVQLEHQTSSTHPHILPLKRSLKLSVEQREAAIRKIGREAERIRSKYGRELSGRSKNGKDNKEKDGKGKRDKAQVELWNADQDLEYFVTLEVGTPAQQINVTIDTGSSDLWIQTAQCTEGCFSNITAYDPTSSTSYESSTSPVSITYGSGAIAGTLGHDTISLSGSLSLPHTPLILAEKVDSLLSPDVSISGLLGLGWQAIASSKEIPYWQEVLGVSGSNGSGTTGGAEGLDEKAFGISLLRGTGLRTDTSGTGQLDPGGSFILGGWDSSQIKGGDSSIEWNDLVKEGYWEILIKGLRVNGQMVTVVEGGTGGSGGNPTAAIDTGTTLIAAPSSIVQSIYLSIPNSQQVEGNQGLYAYPFDQNVTVGFIFGEKEWQVSVDDFCYFSFQDSSGKLPGTWCVGAIFDGGTGSSPSSMVPDWIVGDSFLKNVYTIYRAEPPSVGFGELINGPSTTSNSSGNDASTSNSSSTSSSPGAGSGAGNNGGNPQETDGSQDSGAIGLSLELSSATMVMGLAFLMVGMGFGK